MAYRPQNRLIRWGATILSYIFHPLFVPVYIAWFLITVQPYLFSGFTATQKVLSLIQVFIWYSFFPLVTVLLAKALGFIDTIYLKTQKDRIIPYVACGIYYFWACYVMRNRPEYPKEGAELAIAIFIASSAALIMNIYMKVSMHAISMGILVLFTATLAPLQAANYTIYLSIVVLIAGLVCTARMIISDHTPKEIYAGLFLGAASQVAAVWVNGILP
jgi:hypothetical protein